MLLNACALSNRGVLAVTGEERLAFLQGLVTSDVQNMAPRQAIWTGLLSPQGKYRFDFIVFDDDQTLWLDCYGAQSIDLQETLQHYQLRSAVTIKDCAATHAVGAIWYQSGADCDILLNNMFTDPRTPAMGMRVIAPIDQVQKQLASVGNLVDLAQYRAHRLHMGIPDLAEDAAGVDLFWLETGAQDLNAVSFSKGCYVGQEVTARMHHRNALKRKIMPVQVLGETSALPCAISTDVFDVGLLLANSNRNGLALVHLDRWRDAQESMRLVMAGDTLVTPRTLPWHPAL